MIEKAPVFIDRRSGAALISANLFPISHRSLEALVTTLRNFLTAMLVVRQPQDILSKSPS